MPVPTRWSRTAGQAARSGCAGKITVIAGEKKGTPASYKHVCSKCGDKSAYVCTDHKKA